MKSLPGIRNKDKDTEIRITQTKNGHTNKCVIKDNPDRKTDEQTNHTGERSEKNYYPD